MSSFDMYNDSENIISSDEYSDVEDDDLMNTAISSRKTDNFEIQHKSSNLVLKKTIAKKRLLGGKLKKKSASWLNNKTKRERYKHFLPNFIHKLKSIKCNAEVEKNDIVKHRSPVHVLPLDDGLAKQKIAAASAMNSDKKSELPASIYNISSTSLPVAGKDISSIHKSCSSTLKNESDLEDKEVEFESDGDNTLIYKDVNKIFPQYNKIVEKCVKRSNENTVDINKTMANILLDIQSINELIKKKENEWNRLLHLKRVKAEILARLERKKYIIELYDQRPDGQSFTLQELKEVETYLSAPESQNQHNQYMLPSTVQKLVESRANMKTEEVEREMRHADQLHGYTVSRTNMPKAYDVDRNKFIAKCIQPSRKTLMTEKKMEECGVYTKLDREYCNQDKSKSLVNLENLQKMQQNLTGRRYSFKTADNFQHRNNSDAQRDSCQDWRNVRSSNIFDRYGNIPFCQECNCQKAQFVCANCGNQWYCSRNCQVSAWDKHSETCTETKT